MKRAVGLVVLAVIGVTAAPATAQIIDHSRPRVITIDGPEEPLSTARLTAAPRQRILYMNRNGGTYFYGANNSWFNISSIVQDGSVVPPFQLNNTAWAQLMACVRTQFERFDFIVVDEDPGNVDHIESVVGGRSEDIGYYTPGGGAIGGVSPNTQCRIFERSIVFTFSEVYGTNVQLMCETVAQETAHSFGLDHEFYCPDPMTYLSGCGAKRFQDHNAPCGEDEPRLCRCTGATQNSVEELLLALGTSDPVPPTVAITEPADGATLPPGFRVKADAEDDKRITRADLLIDGGELLLTKSMPIDFPTPLDLSYGQHTIGVLVHDVGENQVTSTVTVTVAPECETAAECDPGEDCGGGRCAGPLGSPCADHIDCASAVCAVGPDDRLGCTRLCSSDADCDGLVCLESSSTCWADGGGGGGGGCQAGNGRHAAGSIAAGLLLAALFVMRRNKRS